MSIIRIARPENAATSLTPHPTTCLVRQTKLSLDAAGAMAIRPEMLICIIDSDEAVRRSVTRLLQAEKYTVQPYVSAQYFLGRTTHAGPCCLVMDIDQPGIGGFGLLQILARDSRTEQVIFTSGRNDVRTCAQALKAGAVDFLTKPLKNAELLWAVETALVRSENTLRARKQKAASQALLNHLTPREREVLGYVIAGKINKEIAAELGTGEKTIKKHRGHLMRKLNIDSVAELVHFCLQSGLKPARPYGTRIPYTSLV